MVEKIKRPSELAQEADDEVVATADYFTVNWFVGRHPDTYPPISKPLRPEDMWHRKTYSTLREARAARDAVGRDPQGRKGIIYAVGHIGARELTVFVQDGRY